MEMKGMLDGTVQVDYCVFPADGYETIGQEVMMSAIAACEGIIREMESKGKGVRNNPMEGLAQRMERT